MSAEAVWGFFYSYWPFLVSGVPATARLIHVVERDGWGSITSEWQSISLAYGGTLYSLHIAWLGVTEEWLLGRSRRIKSFLVFLSVSLLLYFLSRSFEGTEVGLKLRNWLEEAIWGNSDVEHPLKAPCEGLEDLRSSLNNGAGLSDREIRSLFHENDGRVQTVIKSLEIDSEQKEDIKEASQSCRNLLDRPPSDGLDREMCHDLLARYHGCLQGALHISEKWKQG